MERLKFLNNYYYITQINTYEEYVKVKDHFPSFDFTNINERNLQYPCMFVGKEVLDDTMQLASIISQSQVDKFLQFSTQYHA